MMAMHSGNSMIIIIATLSLNCVLYIFFIYFSMNTIIIVKLVNTEVEISDITK